MYRQGSALAADIFSSALPTSAGQEHHPSRAKVLPAAKQGGGKFPGPAMRSQTSSVHGLLSLHHWHKETMTCHPSAGDIPVQEKSRRVSPIR